MQTDEQEIRELFDNWIEATTRGDLDLAHRCIAEDAMFLVPGAGQMDKLTFAQAAAGVSPEDSPMEFELKSNILEVRVFGDHAYMLVESSLLITPKNGGPSSKMQGHSLSILEKRDGRWQIFRDANTLTAESES